MSSAAFRAAYTVQDAMLSREELLNAIQASCDTDGGGTLDVAKLGAVGEDRNRT